MNKQQRLIVVAMVLLLISFLGYNVYRKNLISNPRIVVADFKAVVDQVLKKTDIADIPADKLEAHVDNAIKEATELAKIYAQQHNVLILNKTLAIGQVLDITPELLGMKDGK